jgi:hypothetical protein
MDRLDKVKKTLEKPLHRKTAGDKPPADEDESFGRDASTWNLPTRSTNRGGRSVR